MTVTTKKFDTTLIDTLRIGGSEVVFVTYENELLFARLTDAGVLEEVDPTHITYGGETGLKYSPPSEEEHL